MGNKIKISIQLDAELLREIRALATAEKKSISSLLADHLQQIVRARKGYDRARNRALARLREGLDLHWTPPRSRDELHQR